MPELAKGRGKGKSGRVVRMALVALIALLSTLCLPFAYADNLLVGAGGAGGTSTADNGVFDFDGNAGGINGGKGGKGFWSEGLGGGGIAGPVENPGSAVTSAALGSAVYDEVVVGGGGGGGTGTVNGTPGDGTGATGGQGALTITGGLTINQTLSVGGFGGGAGGGEVTVKGGAGGKGGNGVVTFIGGTTTANTVRVGGLAGGGGGSGPFSGAVGGGGAGTLNLGGGSTLSVGAGGLTVNGNGTFNIGNETANGATAGILAGVTGIVNNGALAFNQSDASYTFGVNISGVGKLTQNAGGITVLSGVNTYSGGTTINAGLINFSNTGNFGSGNITLNGGGLQWAAGNTTNISNRLNALGANGGVFDTNGNDVTFSSGVNGTGGLTKTGNGTLTLTGNNTYTGATIIDAGTLALTTTSDLSQSSGVTANGTFDISQTTIGASVQNLSGSGFVSLGSRTLTLINANGSFGGSFTGSGTLIKQGTGQLILNGNSATFTGTTQIQGGMVEVGDADNADAVLGGVLNVGANGTLGGHGTVSGNVQNNGAVAPGGSIGTLTIGGNYAQSANATLLIEVSPTVASQLKVNGSAALNGTLAISYDPGTYTAKTFKLVSAAQGIGGTFNNVTSSGAANIGSLTSSIAYNADDVSLLLTGEQTGAVVIAPANTSIYTALGTSALFGVQAQESALLDRTGRAFATMASTPASWVNLIGSQTKVDDTNGVPGFKTNRYGFLAGLEHKIGDTTAGVAFGYDHSDLDESVTSNSGQIDSLRASLYGARAFGPVNVGATFGAGLDFLSQKRPFGAAGTAEGDHVGQEFNIGGQASLPVALGSVTLTPRVGMRYAYFHANGFGESGAGGQDLNVGADSVRSLQPYAGATLDKAFGDTQRPANVQLRIAYAHEVLDANRAVGVMSQDGTQFTAAGASLPRSYLTVGASLTMHPKKNLLVSVGYDALVNTTHASAQQGSLRVGYQF